MIAFLKGNFISMSPSKLIIEVNGVGYEVQISLNTYFNIKDQTAGSLYTYLHITENSQVLFAFANESDKELFLYLISVSGVGANTARMIQSGMKTDEIIRTITTSNVLQLEKIKGIGKKTAERIILELKDKLFKIQSEQNDLPINGQPNLKNSLKSDALQALIALGINKVIAEKSIDKALAQAPSEINLENLIKFSLKNF